MHEINVCAIKNVVWRSFYRLCRVAELKRYANRFFLCSCQNSYGMAVKITLPWMKYFLIPESLLDAAKAYPVELFDSSITIKDSPPLEMRFTRFPRVERTLPPSARRVAAAKRARASRERSLPALSLTRNPSHSRSTIRSHQYPFSLSGPTTTQGELWNFLFSSRPHVGQMCRRVGIQAVAFFQAALHPAQVKQK